MESHAALPAVLRIAAAGAEGVGLVEPLARGFPLAHEGVQPSAGEQGAGEEVAPVGLAQRGEGAV
ncbi:MAG: hypothetical protein ACREXY_06030 [Gammaproteobacteria bacterium]